MPPPTAKDDWIAQFTSTMMELRPYLSARLATVYAHRAWVRLQGKPPAEAAREWHAETVAPKS